MVIEIKSKKRFFINKKTSWWELHDSKGEFVLGDGSLHVIDVMEDICNMLNKLDEENFILRLELETHEHPLWSTRIAEEKIQELQERNDRQYKLLSEITELMFERNWNKLEDMVIDWEKSEELLEQEFSNDCIDNDFE